MRAVLFILLTGCAPSWRGAEHPVNDSRGAVLRVVREEWLASGLEYTATCQDEQSRIGYLEADDDQMRNLVGYCAAGSEFCVHTTFEQRAASGCAYGVCTGGSVLWDEEYPFPIQMFTGYRVTLVISSYLDEHEKLVALAHEYAHALNLCSLGDGWTHNDARIWGPGGVVERAQSRL